MKRKEIYRKDSSDGLAGSEIVSDENVCVIKGKEAMVKIFGSLMVIAGCSLMGYWMVEQMKRRMEELQDVQRQLLFMKGEIRFGFRPFSEILLQLEQRTKGVWRKFYMAVRLQLEQENGQMLADIWRQAVETKLTGSCLNKQERREWIELGENLGYLDKEIQIALLTVCEEHFAEYRKAMQEKFCRQAKLYQVLGIMSGIFLTVIFV